MTRRERRSSSRLNGKDTIIILYYDNNEYVATLYDIAKGGIAFDGENAFNLGLGKELKFTTVYKYEDIDRIIKDAIFAGECKIIRTFTRGDKTYYVGAIGASERDYTEAFDKVETARFAEMMRNVSITTS